MTGIQLPNGIQVFERGWLSSNNILFIGAQSSALVDSGYSTHAELTTGLVSAALQQGPLDLLLNTHLHSDHCGGNAVLQGNYPEARVARRWSGWLQRRLGGCSMRGAAASHSEPGRPWT